MKKIAKVFLLAMALALALTAALTATSLAEEEYAEGWLLYYASNHVTDQAAFPWWPQHQTANQSPDETGVEAVNAIITGPGYYTTSLKFNWQPAEGAIQFNLILNDAERLFPGYYCEITDIRVNGVSLALKDNLYGVYHDDPKSGMVSIYNTYWDEAWGGAGGPVGHRAWDHEEAAHWLIINPDDIVAGDLIEVDFFFAQNAGEKPDGAAALKVLGQGPVLHGDQVKLSAATGVDTTAWLFFTDESYWPQRQTIDQTGNGMAYNDAQITGEGSYTVGFTFDKNWNGDDGNRGAVGISQAYMKIEDGENLLPGAYVQITDIRLDGQSIDFNNNITVPFTWDEGDVADTAIPLYVSWMNDVDHNNWNRREWADDATCLVLTPSQINDVGNIAIDFIITSAAGQQPTVPVLAYEYKWYPDNTMGVAGYSLRDLGITDKWYHAVPVDLTRDGKYIIPLVASNMHMIGNALVTVEGDHVTVTYETAYASVGNLTIGSECLQWFANLEDITAEFCAAPQSDLVFGQAYSKADLGDVGYLFICNRLTYCQPITDNGIYLPRYIHNDGVWADYRAGLDAMVAGIEGK